MIVEKEIPLSGDISIWHAACPIAAAAVVMVVYSLFKIKIKTQNHVTLTPTANQLHEESDADAHAHADADADVLFEQENNVETDAKYAEELQIQEALLASILVSQTTNNASTSSSSSSSSSSSRSSLSSLMKKNNEIQEICNICLENQESWQMLRNSTCCHSFCYECTSKHATTKIKENTTAIPCPGLNCKSTLDYNILKFIIPKHSLIKWDEMLCDSMILESHKMYCPFTDCSVLLVNDDISITKTDCPVCRRSICAVCRVPWHSEFSCKEFGKLKIKMKRKKDDDDDDMAVALAKKKKWKKCPNCKFYVEKRDGCVHITCRCKYEFCYNCGDKWSSTHGGCNPRSS